MLICFFGLVTTALTMLLGDKGGERERDRVRLGQVSADQIETAQAETPRVQKKFFPKEMHEMFGISFMIIGFTHLILNRRMLYRYSSLKK